MRFAAMTFIGTLTLAAAALPASAAPVIAKADLPAASNVIQVSGGCGPAYHRDGWGYCVPNPYAYSWYGAPYYAAYYRPHWHHYW